MLRHVHGGHLRVYGLRALGRTTLRRGALALELDRALKRDSHQVVADQQWKATMGSNCPVGNLRVDEAALTGES